MNTTSKLATLFAATSLAVVGAASAFAETPMTAAFVANVHPNVDVLDSSSRLALTHSDNPRLRAFAHREAVAETIAGNALIAFSETNTPPPSAPLFDANGGPLAPVTGLAALPLDVAANVTTGIGDGVGNVLSGRSVAIDNPLAPPMAAPTPRPLVKAGADDLDRLQDLHGRQFDALYKSTQRDALRQLSVLYRDYLQNGSDDALRAMASRELPKINRWLAELDAI
jgi:predicted outer membrane protein